MREGETEGGERRKGDGVVWGGWRKMRLTIEGDAARRNSRWTEGDDDYDGGGGGERAKAKAKAEGNSRKG